ncbi:MAG: DUF3127 domain-containing protein [Saprospiraceae bacterium]|nr:DUF3127 domain-containing protein [Saprospiraceae bacterium]
MAFEVEGKLYKKFDTQKVTDTFQKREFVIEMEDGMYPQIIKFQLTQNNCDKLDSFNEGDQIKVTFNLRGREYTKEGRTSYFTNLDAWRLDKVGAAEAAPGAPAQTEFPSANDEPAIQADMDDLPF